MNLVSSNGISPCVLNPTTPNKATHISSNCCLLFQPIIENLVVKFSMYSISCMSTFSGTFNTCALNSGIRHKSIIKSLKQKKYIYIPFRNYLKNYY